MPKYKYINPFATFGFKKLFEASKNTKFTPNEKNNISSAQRFKQCFIYATINSKSTSSGNNGKGTNHLGICLMKVRAFYFPGQGNPLESEDSAMVIMACTHALRAEMQKRGLSADSKYPTH